MGWRKTSKTLVYLLGLASLMKVANCYCPDSQACECSIGSIKCICHQREDIMFPEAGGLEEEPLLNKGILIKDCGKVEILKFSLSERVLEKVYISEVLELYIEPYSFDGSLIDDLQIHNISEFRLEPYSLGNIKSVVSLIINNATLENLLPSILGDSGVKNVSILNCHIGTISSRALHFQNLESLLFQNNVINAFDLTSIAVSNIKNFIFNRNMVIQSNFGSMSLLLAENVDFGYCTFRHIHSSMIITSNIETFSFHDSHVEHLDERAFWSIQASEKIRFYNNQINLAGEDSLLPNLGPNAINHDIVETTNNTFVCDCNLEWLFVDENPSYNLIKEQNVCHDPPHLVGLRLSQLKLSLDKYGTCITLEPFVTTSVMSSTVSATVVSEKPNPTTRKWYHSTDPPIRTITTALHSKKPNSTTRKWYHSTDPPIQTTASTQSKVKEKYTADINSAGICSYHSLVISLLSILTISWV